MLGHGKHKRARVRVVRLGPSGECLSVCNAADFQPPEDVILSLCLEYFNDENPCHIHRSAVCLRALAELRQACPIGETVPVSTLPEALRRFFDAETACVRVEEGDK